MKKILTTTALAFLLAPPLWSAVERVDVTERGPFASGMTFGEVGYEKIRGTAHIELDPTTASNARIVDLDRAPRDADGKVRFTSEFLMLRPLGRDSTLIYRFDGSFSPFPRSKGEADADSRKALSERYPSRSAFEGLVRTAADRQQAAGFLLHEDLERAVNENLGLYDRILSRDRASSNCDYLFNSQPPK